MTTPIDVDRNSEPPTDTAPAPEHLAIQASPEVVAFAETAHRGFLKSIETAIASEFNVSVEAIFMGTVQSFMSRYGSDDDTEFLNIVMEIEPGIGCAVLRFSSALLHKVLNLLLASPAGAANERGASLTEIELHLLRNLFQLLATALRNSWSAVPDVKFVPAGERSQALCKLHSDVFAMALRSILRIDGVEGTFDVVVPCFLARRSTATRGLSTEGRAEVRITSALAAAKVEMEAVLSRLTIRLGDLVELTPGQILLAERVSDSTFEFLLNKQKHFTGELASVGDHYGFQLTGRVSSKE